MEETIKISLISYTNTKPFVFGLLNSQILDQKIKYQFDSPAECARKLILKEVDLGIVPVAALIDIPDYSIISDYCIGSDGDVNSVFLLSNKPLKEIRTIGLDPQSRTSNNLTRILCKHYWKIDPEFMGIQRFNPSHEEDIISTGSMDLNSIGESYHEIETDAQVLIGDRTFSIRSQYPYVFDLGGEWKKFTGLPFVFAVWASHKVLSPDFQEAFNIALQWGLDHRQAVIDEILSEPHHDPGFDYSDYLYHKLSFDFSSSKKEALELYLKFLRIEMPSPEWIYK